MLVGRVPIDDVSAGEYELRVTVDAGRADDRATATVTGGRARAEGPRYMT